MEFVNGKDDIAFVEKKTCLKTTTRNGRFGISTILGHPYKQKYGKTMQNMVIKLEFRLIIQSAFWYWAILHFNDIHVAIWDSTILQRLGFSPTEAIAALSTQDQYAAAKHYPNITNWKIMENHHL